MNRIHRSLFILLILFVTKSPPVFAAVSGDFWNKTLENHGTVMLLIEGKSGAIIRANKAAATFYGYPQATLQKMHIQDINALSPSQVEQERMAAVNERKNRFVFPHKMKSGEIRTVEVHSYPVDDAGKLLFSIVNDITAKVEAEKALQDQNRRLSRAENMASIGHWEYHLDTNEAIFSPNAAIICGLPSGKTTIEAITNIILPEDRVIRDTGLQNLVNLGTPYDVEFRIKRPSDGKIVDIRSKAEYDPATRTVFGTMMDITNYNQVLRHAERQRNIIIIVILSFLAVTASGLLSSIHLLRLRRKSEHQLRESMEIIREQERQLRHLMDDLPGMVYRCRNDSQWTMLFVSNGVQMLLGYSADDLIGNRTISYNDMILPEYREYLWNAWQEAINSRKPLTVEYRIRTASNRIKWVWEQGSGIYDDNGELIFIEGLIIDITAQKEAEETLRKREQHLQVTLQSIGDAVIATDIDGKITYMNPVAANLTGWLPEDAYNRPLCDVFYIINTVTRQPVVNPVDLVLESGSVIGLANHTSLVAKDGTEYQIADSAAPIIDNDGSTLGVILVFHDVTASYKAKEDLAASEKRFRELFEHSIDAFAIHRLVLDDEGNPIDYIFLQANKAFEKHTGLRVNDIIGQRVTDIYPGIEKTGLIQKYGQVVLTGKPISFEYHFPLTKQHFNTSAYAVGEDQFVVIFENITDRKQQEEALRHSENRFRQLVELAPDAIFVQTEGRFSYVNQAAVELFGAVEKEQLIGQPVLDRFHPDYRQVVTERIHTLIAEKKSVPRLEEVMLKIDGTPLDVEVAAVPCQFDFKDAALVYAQDISERKHAEARLHYLTFHDVVTGLHNRTFFEEEIHRLDTEGQLPLSIIMADVNGLKIINDSLGHQQGDKLLMRVANILKSACRAEDIVARWGGDEFVILLPHATDEQTNEICNRIEIACDEANEDPVKISLAFGFATKSGKHQDIKTVLKQAEDAMYRGKMNKASSSKNALVTSLQRALGEKSHETEQHAQRLQELALAIGRKIGLSTAEQDEIALLSLLHDIGKVGISENILNKNGPLTVEEREVINKHPEIGYRIAVASPDLISVAHGILSHHERWDGTGYPRKLKGEAIPLAARIVSLADAFEAMTCDRPYRKAMSITEALQELKRCAGSQFDPYLVTVFVEMISQSEYVTVSTKE